MFNFKTKLSFLVERVSGAPLVPKLLFNDEKFLYGIFQMVVDVGFDIGVVFQSC